jgi:hypothetical protein
MTSAGSRALAGLGYGDPHSSGRGEGQEGKPGLGTRPQMAAPRRGAGPGGAFMGGPDARAPPRGRPVIISVRDLRESPGRARGRCRGRLLSQRRNGPHPTPSPRSESRPPPDSPARDPGMCAAHSSRLLAESEAGQPCRPPLWPHTDRPGLAGRIGPRPLPHNASRSAATRAPCYRNADHAPRSVGGHSPIKPQQVTAMKGAWAFAT